MHLIHYHVLFSRKTLGSLTTGQQFIPVSNGASATHLISETGTKAVVRPQPEKLSGRTYLIVDGPEESIGFVRLPSDPACQHVLAGIVKPVLDQDPGHIFNLLNPQRNASVYKSVRTVH